MKRFDQRIFLVGGIIGVIACLAGCQTERSARRDTAFLVPEVEASWIMNGAPMEFEGELWYPRDDIEVLEDHEVFLVGTYRDVQVFAEKIDVRPYNRLYTKFDKNKFRIFEKKDIDD